MFIPKIYLEWFNSGVKSKFLYYIIQLESSLKSLTTDKEV